ncbi:MAG: hypothetical protein M1828_004068 [Chrysothrix sp. TS-e1954]|nr:MAG: hypothetical protein M1828_004068 [Chrysothrix sp. TS-e1954]
MPQVNLQPRSSSVRAPVGSSAQSAAPNTSPTDLANSPGTSSQHSTDSLTDPSSTSFLQSSKNKSRAVENKEGLSQEDDPSDDSGFEDWDDQDFEDSDMPSDLRPPFTRHNDGKSQTPLLNPKESNGYGQSPRPGVQKRRSTFREHDPDAEARQATRRRYTYAAFFLVVSLISFTIQTETAVYIKKYLGWKKSYAMLYFTHGSWSMLWFLQLAIIRIQKWNMPWHTFWRRHVQILRQTALMIQHQDVLAPVRYGHQSPVPYMLKTTALVTCALTVAGGAWYVAVSMTTASDLTAIYNCSAFFAYAFSVPILREKLRWSKVIAVAVAIAGVLVVAYGDTHPPKSGNKSGGGTGGKTGHPEENEEADNRALGNLVIGVGSVLYGFYEVLYKKWACPPEETSPGRSMIFANCFGSMIGGFTLSVLWIPLPFLHFMGWEIFEWPRGEQAWMLLISVFANAIFSGSFLVLISLTSPVLSSVAALLTIFLVALVDQLLPKPLHTDLSKAAIGGGLLIIAAFLVLSYATYREMDEERKKKAAEEIDVDDEEP